MPSEDFCAPLVYHRMYDWEELRVAHDARARRQQVRRKADPAKALVQEWVRKWRDERGVSSEVSYKQINGASAFSLRSLFAWEAGMGVPFACQGQAHQIWSPPLACHMLSSGSTRTFLLLRCNCTFPHSSAQPSKCFLLVRSGGVRRGAAALQQLGEFYMRRGQRARLPRADGDQLLRRLGAAELALPPRPGAA